ncbi:MAG TPA: dihydropteroate synthase [Actinomycetota bacterium]|jgi:dihydropteroate synthase|nr:dihydropteroate synthase [Actinomycetota bacterium]
MKLRGRDFILSLDRTAVMGVLNVTPDSFSDGGRWLDPDLAIAHGREMASQGAAIVDVGGESTRPGAAPVPEEEELARVVPVIEALADGDAPISIDTRKPSVARRAIEAGASIVNDTTGEEFDHEMDAVVATTGAAMVIMHSRGTPATMRSLTDYEDVVGDVASFLRWRAESLVEAGVARESIALDPGFGFAKTPEQNLVLLNRIDEILKLGYPVLVGTSRKSFIGAVLDLPEDQRVEGTAATVAWAVAKGARIVRVHDVEQMTRVVRMAEAIRDMRLS